jgi:hypothetical protein
METRIKSPWKDWWQTDKPCIFPPEQADNNCKYLINALGNDWLASRIKQANSNTHPLISNWLGQGADNFIILNALAEDLRILEAVPGLDLLVNDLKDSDTYMPTWHTIHSAALVERGERGTVSKFSPEAGQKLPDFLIIKDSKEIPAEAKFLTLSETQTNFNQYAKRLLSDIETEVLVDERIYPTIDIVCKNADNLPDISAVVETIKIGFQHFNNGTIVLRSELFNIILDIPNQDTSNFSIFKDCCIYCPKSVKEDLRVVNRIKDASKQLGAYKSSTNGGVLFLGLTEYQDPHHIKSLIYNRYVKNQYSGISMAFFIRTMLAFATPERGTMDFISIITNPNKTQSERFNLKFRPIDLWNRLFETTQPEQGIPAYKSGGITAKIKKAIPFGLQIPDIRKLLPEMLE